MNHKLLILLMVFLLCGTIGIHAQEDTETEWSGHIDEPLNPVFIPRTYLSPYYYAYPHYGLNLEVGTGVQVGWGKNNPWKGASFFTGLTGLYLFSPKKAPRWTFAFGGTYTNYQSKYGNGLGLGLMGSADYQINERMNIGAFILHETGSGIPLYNTPYNMADTPYSCHAALPFVSPVTTVGANFGIRLTEKAAINFAISMSRQQVPPYHIPDTGRR